MDKFSVNPRDIIFSLDIGTRSVIGTVGIVKDKKFNVIAEKYIEHSERAMIDGQIHDINIVASEVKEIKKSIEEEIGVELTEVAIAAAGRFLRTTETKIEIQLDADKEIDKDVVRSLELTAVKEAENQISNSTQSKLYCVGYSVKNYYLNEYVISNLLAHKGEKAAVEVIATFLPRSVIDSLYSVMDKVNLKVSSLTLEPIAAMEAVVPQNFRLLNIALVDIGAGTSDIAISSNDTVSAYGMVPLAGDEITEVIAKGYLVDFNTAEVIKKACSTQDNIKYMDVLGMENEISSKEVIKLITPTIDKITTEISNKIVDLNGGKTPSAIFLVGGGAYTPNFGESLSEKLNLPTQRIAIKSRKDVVEAVDSNEELKSIGVTVLGIALIAIKKSGHDFIDVTVNEKVISLFNAYKHTVKDVMLQAGINPGVLIGKNGKNIRFTLNGITRVAFGKLAKRASININGQEANLDSEVREGDNIEIIFAKNGESASPKVCEYFKSINSISFYVNNEVENLEPVVFINDKKASIQDNIKENDDINIVFPGTLDEYIKYYEKGNYIYRINDEVLENSYVIKEGDRIFAENIEEKEGIEEAAVDLDIIDGSEEIQNLSKIENLNEIDNKKNINDIKDINNIAHMDANKEDNNIDNLYDDIAENVEQPIIKIPDNLKQQQQEEQQELQEQQENSLEVIVNGEKIKLKGKENYIFIDIFNYMDFDLSSPKGNIILLLNNNKAGYYDELCEGDVITIRWE